MTSSKELLLGNPTKTVTFNGHAKSSLIKNATSWHDTDLCCVADVGVSWCHPSIELKKLFFFVLIVV